MNNKTIVVAALVGTILSTGGASAQSPEYMSEYCANATQSFFQEFDARTDTTYEGKRTDGTHAVNGTIYMENRSETFQCSYAGDGVTMVDFIAEGKSWPAFAQSGEPSPYQQAASEAANPMPAGEAAVVKFRPGEYGAMLEGTVRGREDFDYRLDASAGQRLFAELTVDGTNGDGTIYFNIIPPGESDVAIFVGSRDGNVADVRLPETGPYIIRLYLMGNDRDTDKTAGYDLDVSIQ